MMHLKEICRIVRGVLRVSADRFVVPAPMDPVVVRGVSTDTRTLQPGDIFFALRGPNFDGHDYMVEAFRRGAVAAIARRPVPAPGPVIVVDNVLTALGNLAGVYRMMLGARVVAVTGTNGKTTTKEMIACILGADRRVVRAKDSWNNYIGVPLTLFHAGPDTDYIVIEVGTNRRGEVARLGAIARPDAAVVTSVSEAHIEGLGTLEGVAEEKASLLGTLRGSGFGVIPSDAPLLRRHVNLPGDKVVSVGLDDEADLTAEDVRYDGEGLAFTVEEVPFRLGLLGEWNVTNALAASAVAMFFGATLEECADRLRELRPPKMRMERLKIRGFHILNDAYNSNPRSAENAIREFAAMPASGRRVVVLGDMLELGKRSRHWHREIGRFLTATPGIDALVGVGPQTRYTLEHSSGRHFESVREAAESVRKFLRPGDTILLKGSRGVRLEDLIKAISEQFAARERVSA
ncbi:MAG: UDP-N-acetylmuramoyl-tripeptide--D-alanyl-D-alanine ligase [Planctomycetota bacterium]|jgi:UDP-N-acetylmuramoyl-tripeptide--D-alanyl-D-alanine ligase